PLAVVVEHGAHEGHAHARIVMVLCLRDEAAVGRKKARYRGYDPRPVRACRRQNIESRWLGRRYHGGFSARAGLGGHGLIALVRRASQKLPVTLRRTATSKQGSGQSLESSRQSTTPT